MDNNLLLKDLDFNFIELPKFDKTEEELQTLIDKWVFFIKNSENLTVILSNIDDEGLKSAYTEADKHTWSKADLEAYEYARMRETDELTREIFVAQKAQLSKQIEIAKNLIALGLDNVTIAQGTGLTLDQIERLLSESKE